MWKGNIFKSVENVNLDTVVAYKSKGEKHHFLDTYDVKSEEQGERYGTSDVKKKVDIKNAKLKN